MRKEITIAIFAGLAIGLAIAFGAYRVNSNMPVTDVLKESNTLPSTPQNQDSNQVGTTNLSLTGIENGTIYTSSPVAISGIGSKNSKLVISSDSEDFVLTTSDDGTFSQSLKLTKGVNKILVATLDNASKKTSEQSYTVIYYPDFEKELSGN